MTIPLSGYRGVVWCVGQRGYARSYAIFSCVRGVAGYHGGCSATCSVTSEDTRNATGGSWPVSVTPGSTSPRERLLNTATAGRSRQERGELHL